MGCSILTRKKIVIKSNTSLPLQKSPQNEKKNNFQRNTNASIIIPKQKIISEETFNIKIQKEKNKIGKRSIKAMNILKEISYDEVCDCAKYF